MKDLEFQAKSVLHFKVNGREHKRFLTSSDMIGDVFGEKIKVSGKKRDPRWECRKNSELPWTH